jgi:DNA adenine methylase
VSFDAAPRILGLYEGFDQITYSLSYSAADRYRGAEAMFFSPDLELPDVQLPANIRVGVVDRVRRAEAVLF